MRLRSFVLLLFAVTMLFSGCSFFGKGKAVNNPTLESHETFAAAEFDASVLIGYIFSAYENFNRNLFVSFLSKKFLPSPNVILVDIENNYPKQGDPKLTYVIESAFLKDDIFIVHVTWEKYLRSQNNVQVYFDSGKTEFDYKFEDKKWVLYKIKGKNPFV